MTRPKQIHVFAMDEERFWAKVPQPSEGCWVWTGRKDPLGYGRFDRRVRENDGHTMVSTLAHRFAYESRRGPIPEDLQLDHLCRNTSCVRPEHLDPVTNAVNSRRSIPGNAKKTACPRGHPYDDANTHYYLHSRSGGIWRFCIACEWDRRGRRLTANAAVLSGLQSVASAHREEARLAMFGQERSA